MEGHFWPAREYFKVVFTSATQFFNPSEHGAHNDCHGLNPMTCVAWTALFSWLRNAAFCPNVVVDFTIRQNEDCRLHQMHLMTTEQVYSFSWHGVLIHTARLCSSGNNPLSLAFGPWTGHAMIAECWGKREGGSACVCNKIEHSRGVWLLFS